MRGQEWPDHTGAVKQGAPGEMTSRGKKELTNYCIMKHFIEVFEGIGKLRCSNTTKL